MTVSSSPDGLTQAEAEKRLAQYGPNEIEEKKTNMFLKFLMYFWGPIPWMIEAAVILSAVSRHWLDFFIILLLLAANAVVGFWEEREAGNAIKALKAKLAVKARVKRDGKWITPAARELVPGDVIRLRSTQNCQVNSVVVFSTRCKRTIKDYLIGGDIVHTERIAQCQFILRKGTGLVSTQHIYTR